jgi:hypothetical protein
MADTTQVAGKRKRASMFNPMGTPRQSFFPFRPLFSPSLLSLPLSLTHSFSIFSLNEALQHLILIYSILVILGILFNTISVISQTIFGASARFSLLPLFDNPPLDTTPSLVHTRT